ncbi:MAG: AI-2E family transporter [Thermoguttaceae bacterium]
MNTLADTKHSKQSDSDSSELRSSSDSAASTISVTKLQNHTGIGLKVMITVSTVIIIAAGMKAAQSLLAPFLLAVFFAMVLLPPLRWLKDRGLSGMVAVLVLSALVLLCGCGIVLVLSQSLGAFAKNIPTYQKKLTDGMNQVDDWINVIKDKIDSMDENIRRSLPTLPLSNEKNDSQNNNAQQNSKESDSLSVMAYTPPNMMPNSEMEPESANSELSVHESAAHKISVSESDDSADLSVPIGSADSSGAIPVNSRKSTDPNYLMSQQKVPEKSRLTMRSFIQVNSLMAYLQQGIKDILNVASISFLIVVLVIFMLFEAASFPAKLQEAFGERDISSTYLKKIAEDTWNYTKIKTIVSILTGAATTLGLWYLGVEYAVLWGLLMFFLNYIPNIGPIIASIPPILLSLVDQGIPTSLLVTSWLIFVNMLFGYGVEPRYLGAGLGMSSFVVLISLVIWGWLLGPIGMFLSAPLTIVLQIVLQNDPNTKWIATLMSDSSGTSVPKMKSQ